MRLLHLSDIHFGNDKTGGGKHAFTTNGKPDPVKLVDILRKLPSPNVVVISGDLGWSGVKADYDDALQFCKGLKNVFPVDFVVAPGNHDVDRSDSIDSDKRQDAFISFVRSLYGTELASCYPLLDRTDLGLSVRQRLISFHDNKALGIVMVSINSATQVQGWTNCKKCGRRLAKTPAAPCDKCGMSLPDDDASIFIEPKVADQVEALLRSSSDNALRVFILHHNMFPFSEPLPKGKVDSADPGAAVDVTMMANSAALQAWLARNGFHLVLHGHKHQPHGRQDTLFRRSDGPDGRRIVVLGAGSSGVAQGDRGTEPLSYFVVNSTRLSDRRFQIRSEPMKIEIADLTPYSTPDFGAFTCETGPVPTTRPLLFCAERMVDCHGAISEAWALALEAAMGRHVIWRNFVSIVDSAEFVFPSTTRLEGDVVDDKEVLASFYALHPEHDEVNQEYVPTPETVKERLRGIAPRFRFQHGPRMWGMGAHGPERQGSDMEESPIERAVKVLRANPESSHAFVGIFQPHIDSTAHSGPPPALTGIQFSIEDNRLDVTFTFRKLDLSFWWVVNMLEAINLCKWVMSALDNRYKKGRITFFATLAEWKREGAGVAFKTTIDEMSLEELIEATIAADHNDPSKLLDLLVQKRSRTNENNIDATGVNNLVKIVIGVLKAKGGTHAGRLSEVVLRHLQAASEALMKAEDAARRDPTFRALDVKAALKKADEAVLRAEDALRLSAP